MLGHINGRISSSHVEPDTDSGRVPSALTILSVAAQSSKSAATRRAPSTQMSDKFLPRDPAPPVIAMTLSRPSMRFAAAPAAQGRGHQDEVSWVKTTRFR